MLSVVEGVIWRLRRLPRAPERERHIRKMKKLHTAILASNRDGMALANEDTIAAGVYAADTALQLLREKIAARKARKD